MNCNNCGREIKNADATFCPYCAKALYSTQRAAGKRSAFSLTAGILTIIGSCIAIAASIFFIIAGAATMHYGFYGIYAFYLIVGVVGILAFSFGLAGGISALKRKRIVLALFAGSILIATGAAMTIPLWFLGVPVVILSIISVVFVAVSKSEFT